VEATKLLLEGATPEQIDRVHVAFGMPMAAWTATQKNEKSFSVIFRFIVTPLFLFSGTFYPITAYPPALQLFVQLTPLYQGVDLIRALITGVVDPGILWHVVYLSVMGVIGLAIVARRLDKLLLK
jgi:ABC-type polysaccharide/polyol phosphate export permease